MKQDASIFTSHNSQDKLALIMLNREIHEARHRLSRLSFLVSHNQRPFYDKVCSYQEQLEQCNVELATPYIPVGRENTPLYIALRLLHTYRIEELKQKQVILQQLVDIGVQLLAIGQDSVLEYEFRRLEEKFKPVTFLCDDIEALHLVPVSKTREEVKSALVQKIQKHLKYLRTQAKLLIKKIRLFFILDIRQRFRSIMRFLFKNLDDCSDEYKAGILFQALCFIKNNYSNAKYKYAYSNASGVSQQ